MDYNYVALDLEFTNNLEKLVAIGYVYVENCEVKLSTGKLYIICYEEDIGRSSIIHRITRTLIRCISINEAHELLRKLCSNNVLIVYSDVDIKYLVSKVALKNVKYIDVLKMWSRTRNIVEGDLSLMSVLRRECINFLLDFSHNPLVDAINTAILYVKLVKEGAKPIIEVIQ